MNDRGVSSTIGVILMVAIVAPDHSVYRFTVESEGEVVKYDPDTTSRQAKRMYKVVLAETEYRKAE